MLGCGVIDIAQLEGIIAHCYGRRLMMLALERRYVYKYPVGLKSTGVWCLALLLLVGGCANSNAKVVEPSKVYRLKKQRAHAVTYDGRGRGAYMGPQDLVKLCAEPPPDVSANLKADSSFSLDLEALAEYEAFKVALQSATATQQSASSEIADAVTRTELVLFMRDALYRVCEMHFNRVLDAQAAQQVFREVISAGRALGQRDNVAKLISLAEVLATVKNPDPALIHDVVGTIRFLAAADYLLLNNTPQSNATVGVLLSVTLGKDNIASARKILVDELKRVKAKAEELKVELENAKEELSRLSGREKKALEQRIAELQSRLTKAEALHRERTTVYTELFTVSPPIESQLTAPEPGG